MELEDGIDYFKKAVDAKTVAGLLGACTIWIDPDGYRMLPVWSPYTYRKAPLYKADWTERQTNKGEPKFEGNVSASKAQNRYLGISGRNRDSRPNWACCHIWGNDDPSFQADHAEVNDPRYFSCPANMVLVPSPLKTFTDTVPEVKTALRFAASLLYGFWPEGRARPTAERAGLFLPDVWLERETIEFVKMDSRTKSSLESRYVELTELQRTAGPEYPRDNVNRAVAYWNDQIPESLFSNWDKVTRGDRQ